VPIGPQQILTAKQFIVKWTATVANLQAQIAQMEAELAAFDPALVNSVDVAGYPPSPSATTK